MILYKHVLAFDVCSLDVAGSAVFISTQFGGVCVIEAILICDTENHSDNE